MDLWTVILSKKTLTMKNLTPQASGLQGQTLWRGEVHTSAYSAQSSLVPSGGCSVNPATSGASGDSGLQRALFSAAVRQRYGTRLLIPSSEGAKVVRSVTPCWSFASGHQSDYSRYLIVLKTERGVASDHRSASAEPCYQTLFIQDTQYQTDCVSDQL